MFEWTTLTKHSLTSAVKATDYKQQYESHWLNHLLPHTTQQKVSRLLLANREKNALRFVPSLRLAKKKKNEDKENKLENKSWFLFHFQIYTALGFVWDERCWQSLANLNGLRWEVTSIRYSRAYLEGHTNAEWKSKAYKKSPANEGERMDVSKCNLGWSNTRVLVHMHVKKVIRFFYGWS